MTAKPSSGPLAGVTVLDLSRILAGPTATQALGDLGAEVIKIERPGAGDDTRAWGPPYVARPDGAPSDLSAYFMSANRNKRSVAVDVAHPEGARLVRALARQADVFIENFKVGALARYGLDYASIAAEKPDIVYCSITGFGQTGPNAHRAGYDLMAQGAAGVMSLTGAADGEPMKVGVGVADVMCGMYAALGLLAALRHRDRTGEGQHIDLALVDSTVAWLINEGVNYLTSGAPPKRRGNAHPNIAPYQVYEAADGHVIIAVGNDRQFVKFCGVLGAPALPEDPRFTTNSNRCAHRDALGAALAPLIKAQTRAALLAGCEREGVPAGPIQTVPEVFADAQVAARAMRVRVDCDAAAAGSVELIGNPLKFSKTPVAYAAAPPSLGADTEAVIRERLGDEALARARSSGALGETGGTG